MNILFTGITGLLGSSVATELLRNHSDYRLVAVARGGRNRTAQERVEETIKEQCKFDGFPQQYEEMLTRITIISGDVTDLPFDQIAQYAPFDTMFHCAADVNLGKDPDGKVYQNNFAGTQCSLKAISHFKIPSLHYVSTAYVAGKSVGRVMEDDMPAKDFVNSYEKSKYDCEKLVRACNVPFTIYRPSIIVGRLSDGLIRKPLAFYRILSFLGQLKKHRCSKRGVDPKQELDMSLRLESDGSDSIYFVPIDYAQKAISQLFAIPHKNKTYHITGDSPVSTQEICDAVSFILKATGLKITKKIENPSADEKVVNRIIGDLMPYFTTQIIFDNSNIRKDLGDQILAWTMGLEFLKKMAYAYYKQEIPEIVD